jgi:hypothetical protein
VDWQDPDDFGQRRKFTRRDVRLPARVLADGRELEGTTENISPGGAFLSVELPKETVDLFASIELPQGRGLFVQAKVRWRRANPPGVGIEFSTFLENEEGFSRSA